MLHKVEGSFMTIVPAVRSGRWPRAVLFDLDGTLIDSVPDIAAAANVLLAEAGHEALSQQVVRTMIGNGIGKLVQRALAAAGTEPGAIELDAATERMMQIYRERLTVETVLLQGAREVLESLHPGKVSGCKHVKSVRHRPA
jgi:phosphoglycolate phosphatase